MPSIIPPEISQAIDFGGVGLAGNIVVYAVYVFFGLLLVGGFGVIYFILTHKFPVTEIPLVASGNKTELAVGKAKWNRFRWNKTKTAWKALFPLFSKKEIEPFDPKFRYAGNRIFAFKLGAEYIPACINIDQDENKNIAAQINPKPMFVRNWQSQEHKKNAEEFAKNDWWSDNKFFVITIVIIGFNLALCAATIYFTYKFVGGESGSIDALSSAISSFGNIPGAPPG